MITGPQLRAARGLLDWTRAELAKEAKISQETVKNIEKGTFRPQDQTVQTIYKTFAQYDVVFTDNQGVKIDKELVKTFSGREGYKEYLDHIYSTLKDNGGSIRQFNTSEEVLNFGSEYSAAHLERMSEIKNLDARVLVLEGDHNFPASYCSYRWLGKNYVKNIPYYLYGNNVSMFSMKAKDNREIISIRSDLLASIFLEQFEWFWNSSTVPEAKRR